MSTPVSSLGLLKPGVTGATPGAASSGAATGATGDGSNFGGMLGQLIAKVDDASVDANDKVAKMIDGTGDVHEAMIALQNADTMLQLTVQVRNKLVQAYQDIMRMPV